MVKPSHGLFAIVADVGGTHIRFGSLASADAPLECIESYRCADFNGLAEALRHYQQYLAASALVRAASALASATPAVLCLALPGDVQASPINLVNLSWTVDVARLAREFECRILTINDFSAQAQAIPVFSEPDLAWLRGPATDNPGLTRAIIGPGTGLGVSALLPGGQVVESEGGHISFAPQTPLQQQLLGALWPRFPRLSVERLISGPGLANLYRGLGLLEGDEQHLSPEQITSQARAGDPRSEKAVTLFIQIFGSVCGDLALTLGAKGGVYLSGGLLQGLGELFDAAAFLEQFNNKGRYHDYCRDIPVARVLSSQPGLLGATRVARLQPGASD